MVSRLKEIVDGRGPYPGAGVDIDYIASGVF
jgi:hypothetical protein